MATTEERVINLENISVHLARLATNHEERMAKLEGWMAKSEERWAALSRDGQKLQRIWIRVAVKNGWDDLLDEEDRASI